MLTGSQSLSKEMVHRHAGRYHAIRDVSAPPFRRPLYGLCQDGQIIKSLGLG